MRITVLKYLLNENLNDDVNEGYVISSTVYRAPILTGLLLDKADTAGHVLWVHTYGGERDEHCYDMDLTLMVDMYWLSIPIRHLQLVGMHLLLKSINMAIWSGKIVLRNH